MIMVVEDVLAPIKPSATTVLIFLRLPRNMNLLRNIHIVLQPSSNFVQG